MKILYTAFKGNNNSSKLLLDKINCSEVDKLYLTNSFNTSVKELIEKLKNNNYDLIISIGLAPLNKDIIKLETKAKKRNIYETNYDYSCLKKNLEFNGFNPIISQNAGTYLCNNIYYYGLKYIYEEKKKCKMIFIHIPKIKNISNIDKLARSFNL